MHFFSQARFIKVFIICSSICIVGLIIWNMSIFYNKLKQEEQLKMKIWVNTFSEIAKSDFNDPDKLSVLVENNTTPMIIYFVKEDTYSTRNIAQNKVNSDKKIKTLATKFSSEYTPIEIKENKELIHIIYYGNSKLLNKLKLFPLIILVIILLFLAILYYFYTTEKSNEQNKLWAGMAKETAHQIGTPLSSLVGWIELLKTENIPASYVTEMEKDISRLQIITDRFSKIGSLPELHRSNFIETTQNTYNYLMARSSKLIEFSLILPEHPIWVNLNPQLFSWAIENLVKNAIDAVKGRGFIELKITENQDWVFLLIKDNGKGIPKGDFNSIFKPGFTTKKRGWGLGLSLTKRIVEEYHKGKIKVLKSEPQQGTTFEIKIRKIA